MSDESNVRPRKLLRRANLLEDFIKVASTGSVRSAAEKLYLSQSAVTRRIQELELELGFDLFERHVGGMRLTKAGDILLHHAHAIALSCDLAAEELRQLADGDGGELRIAAGPAWSSSICPDAVAALQQKLPRVCVQLTEQLNSVSIPLLVAGKLDVVLGGLLQDNRLDEAIICEPVLDIEHRIFASNSHPLVDGNSHNPREIMQWPMIWLTGSVAARNALTTWRGEAVPQLKDAEIETSALQPAFRLLQNRRHLMVLPHTLGPLAKDHGLAAIQTTTVIGRFSAGLIYRKSTLRIRAFAAFRDVVFREAERFRI